MSGEDARGAREGLLLSIEWQKKKNHLYVLYVFIVYTMMLLSKGTETCMNFRYEWCNLL